MIAEEFDDLVIDRFESCQQILKGKSSEYSRNDDKLHNFKRAGELLGTTPERALLGMMTKHLISIMDMVDDIEFVGTLPSDGLISEKFGDSINYLLLLEGLIKERKGKDKP